MSKLDDGLTMALVGFKLAVEGYQESVIGKVTIDQRLADLETQMTHMQETIDALQRLLLEGR